MEIKNWQEYQHYKTRNPPWIKLYRRLLDDDEWFNLPPANAKALIMLWLLAAETKGQLPSLKKMAFRLRVSEELMSSLLIRLNHWIIPDASIPLAESKQDACPERETERETERELHAAKAARVPKGSDTWNSYKVAYAGRYGVEPVRNQTVNSLICRVVDKLGIDESPLVAAYYLTHSNSFYLQKGHPVNLLLADAEKLRTEWATHTMMTSTQALADDKRSAKGQMWQRLLKKEESKIKEVL